MDITQEKIDLMVAETRTLYNKELAATGESQTIAIMRKGNPLMSILARYEEVRQHVIDEGFECPQLVEGLTVNFGE